MIELLIDVLNVSGIKFGNTWLLSPTANLVLCQYYGHMLSLLITATFSLVLVLQAAAKVRLLNFSQKLDFKTYGAMELITLKPLVVPLFCLGAGPSGYKLHRPWS